MAPLRPIQGFVVFATLILAMHGSPNANGGVVFDFGGLGGSGTNTEVSFAYQRFNGNDTALAITFENQSAFGHMHRFAFHVPVEFGQLESSTGVFNVRDALTRPEAYSQHQSGWVRKWAPSNITGGDGSGDFDPAVFANESRAANGNSLDERNSNHFDAADLTILAVEPSRRGLRSLSHGNFESAFMSELSSGKKGNSLVRGFNDIGPNRLADSAIIQSTQSSVNQVPIPGALALAASGLGMAGLIGLRRARK